MKKLLLFFIFLFVVNCTNITNKNKEFNLVDCPKIFFSSENTVYVNGEKNTLELDKINYKAVLNNYGFTKECSNDKNFNYYLIEILSLVEPINPKNNSINLPIFVFLYDGNNELIEKRYFRFDNKLIYDDQKKQYELTEVINNLKITTSIEIEINYMVVGFVNLK